MADMHIQMIGASARALAKRLREHVISLDWLSLHSLISLNICAAGSYYAYRVGYFIGTYTRTPEMASVFSERKVLQGTFTPQELRWTAWFLLWSALSIAGWSCWILLRDALNELDSPEASLSPKLPRYTPLTESSSAYTSAYTGGGEAQLSWRGIQQAQIQAKRSIATTRIKLAIIAFSFAFAFIKKQHVGTTLIYHSVNSPAIATGSQVSGRVEEWSPADNQQILDNLPYPSGRHSQPVVPKIIHFVFGLSKDFGGKPFGMASYLSIYSAMMEAKPDKVMFWHEYLPHNSETGLFWFERIQQDAIQFGITFELKKARHVESIFDRPVNKFAHKADIVRLEAVLEYGGIYLDLDVFTIRPYEDLRHFDTVLGIEGGVAPVPRQGLCNGIIIGAPGAPFLRRWYDSYKNFNDSQWAEHSVKLPLQLAFDHPEEILVMDPFAFFYPLWNKDGLKMVHSKNMELGGEGWDFDESGQIAYHAWSSFAQKWLKKLSPDRVFEVETSFHRLIRRWISEDLKADWQKAKKSGLVI